MVQIVGVGVDQSVGKVATVVARVRDLVDRGVLRDGDRVPSTRAMAAELGVARGTVVAAYDQLDGEGWIRTRPGAAAVVVAGTATAASAGRAGAAAAGAAGAAGADASASVPAPAPAAVSPRGRRASAGARVIDARPGIPAVTSIAPRDWRAAWRAAAEAPLRNGLSDPLGLPEFRTQVAAQLGLLRGFAPDLDRVVVTAGTSDAISTATEGLRNHLGRAPRVAVEDPGYPTGRRAVVSAGGVVVGVPVDERGLDLAALAALPAVDAVVVSPTHQYPLGSVMPVARRRALLDWAGRTGTLIVEDDYDSEFRHRGLPVPALAALDTSGSVLHLGGFSKTLDPRLRCAWMVLPGVGGARVEALTAARRARGPVVAEPVQVALAWLLRSGAFRRHLGRVRREAAHRRDQIVARLGTTGQSSASGASGGPSASGASGGSGASAGSGASGLEARALDGGLHAVVTWAGPATGRTVVARMAEQGVLVAALEDYGMTPSSVPEGVVIGYGSLTTLELGRALDALVAAVAG